MTEIIDIHAREILDSRGFPTVEVDVLLSCGALGRAAVPSGASTGIYEAHELRDGDARLGGKGVQKPCDGVINEILPALQGMGATHQRDIDDTLIKLDATENKSRLGANALLGVSLATAHAASKSLGIPLYAHVGGVNAHVMPTPMMNILNGGAHADNAIDIQEFMIMPVGANTFHDALDMGAEVFHALKSLLKQKGLNTNVGDEGGFAPNLSSSCEALDCIMMAVEKTGLKAGDDIGLALDCAASEYFEDGKYNLAGEQKTLNSDEMTAYFVTLAKDYPIISIEDPMDEDDWDGWQSITTAMGDKCQLVGDDLFVTNVKRLKRGIDEKAGNALLVKVNQIGTLTETIQAVTMAQRAGFNTVMSHRSGETEDTTIADLAVALNCGQIKTGSLARSDRVAKYNQLLRIEEELGSRAVYQGSIR